MFICSLAVYLYIEVALLINLPEVSKIMFQTRRHFQFFRKMTISWLFILIKIISLIQFWYLFSFE